MPEFYIYERSSSAVSGCGLSVLPRVRDLVIYSRAVFPFGI